MKIAFTANAWRDWEKLPKAVRNRLGEKLKMFSRNPLRYAVKLTDIKIGQYRFRIGDYRVIFDLRGSDIVILTVDHRRDIYK